MKDEPETAEWLASGATGTPGMPVVAGRAAFRTELEAGHSDGLRTAGSERRD